MGGARREEGGKEGGSGGGSVERWERWQSGARKKGRKRTSLGQEEVNLPGGGSLAQQWREEQSVS